MKVAFLSIDAREAWREYGKTEPYFGTAPEAVLQGFGLMPSEVEVHVISCRQQPMTAPEKLAENIWFHSPLVPRIGWLRTGYQGCIRAVRRELRELQPDIVHAQGTERDCALCGVFSGFPNVLTIHGNMRSLARLQRARPFSFGALTGWLEGVALPRAGGVFCNSAYTEAQVKPVARRTWRVPNALRLKFFDPLRNDRGERPRLLTIGGILPQKYQLELLRAARRLHGRGCDFEWLFLGQLFESDYGRQFQTEMREAESAGFARYVGKQETDELIRTLDTGAALVHFSAEESFGLVVAEALSRGLKFFGSDVGGIRDIVEGVEGPELFGERDWDGLVSGLERWLKAGAADRTNGPEVMRQRYHPVTVARQHLDIYRSFLAEGD